MQKNASLNFCTPDNYFLEVSNTDKSDLQTEIGKFRDISSALHNGGIFAPGERQLLSA